MLPAVEQALRKGWAAIEAAAQFYVGFEMSFTE
jgi:hypothetical protein